MRQTAERLLLPFLFLLALIARASTLGLPLEGDSAVLASVADHLGHERGWELAGRAPLVPLLGAMLVASGLPATLAVRWIDVLAAALLAPLLVVVGIRVGVARPVARAAGCLAALHPLALAQAGGLAPETITAGTALLLAAVALLLSPRPVARRLGVACVLLLPLTDAILALYLPALLLAYTARETSKGLERGVLVVGTGLLLVGPGALPALFGSLSWGGPPAIGSTLLLLALAGLLVLCVGLPKGLGRLWRADGDSRSVRRAWILSALVHAGLLAALGAADQSLPWRLVTPALPLLPLLLVAGTAGTAVLPGRWWPHLSRGSMAAACVVTLWLVWGGLQLVVTPKSPGPAGRLHLLRRAVRDAADQAGENGWIVLAVADGRHADQCSLADLNPHHWTWAHREASPDADDSRLRRLLPFPAAAFEPGQSVTVVAEAGASGVVHTFDGAGIYHQEVLRQVGPYVVLRARRP